MRYTTKRNGKNVIPLLNAVCSINMPYWRIDRADDLHRYLSGNAADKLAAYEDAEEQGLLVPVVRCKDCKHRDPEDKKCDCGGLEHTHMFPVSDDWFCADGEMREVEHD